MNHRIPSILSFAVAVLAITASLTGCGKNDAAPASGIPIQSNPLAGPSQAFLEKLLFEGFLGIRNAYAAVSSFSTFNVCVSEVVYELQSGAASPVSSTPLKPGLVSFSPTSQDAMTIGNMDIAAGSVLKNIKFTIATKPELCGGADYAVLFNTGSSGDKKVSQDMSFRFDFASGGYTVASGTAITLFLGDIVNGMVPLANAGTLDNSTIQNVDVGQAR